jgi:hydrogenase maturation protease
VSDERQPVLVATCGNADAGDDAFGALVAQALQRQPPAGVEVVNLSQNPAALLDHLSGRKMLIVVDAVQCPGLPQGALLDVDWLAPDRPFLRTAAALSTHGLSIADQIDLAASLGGLPPQVRLIGANVGDAVMGDVPSQTIRSQAAAAALRIARYAQEQPGK